jgi:hypothetical protein
MVRIHLIIEMIRWTSLAPWEFTFPLPGSLASTFLTPLIGLTLETQIVYARQSENRISQLREVDPCSLTSNPAEVALNKACRVRLLGPQGFP